MPRDVPLDPAHRALVYNAVIRARADVDRWISAETMIAAWDAGLAAEYALVTKQLRRLCEDLTDLWERVR